MRLNEIKSATTTLRHDQLINNQNKIDTKMRHPRLLNDVELVKLEEALTQQEKEQPSCAVTAIRFLLYTGYRPSEVFNLKWEDINLEGHYIDVVSAKTGRGKILLNQKAVDLLASLAPKEENPYVFGKVPGKLLAQIKAAWGTILKRAGIQDLRLSDLRHSFASFCLSQGVGFYTVSKLLGYKDAATVKRLAPLELEHLKEAADKAAVAFG